MGVDLVQKFESYLADDRVEWPEKDVATALGIQTYEMGLDKINEFNGNNPKVLQEGLHTFLSGDSLPYALAGTAYMFLTAAAEKDGTYAQEGINLAMSWLEKAHELEEDLSEINFIEAFVYLRSGELENARLVIDYLFEQAPYYYHLNIAEAQYWHALGELDEMEAWYKKAAELADNVPKRLRLYSQMAQAYQENGDIDTALKYYQKAVYFNKENGRLWHQIAVIYWNQGNLEECARANQKTLKFAPTAGAKKLNEALKKRIEAEKKRR